MTDREAIRRLMGYIDFLLQSTPNDVDTYDQRLALKGFYKELEDEPGDEIHRLREEILKRGLWREAPCILCGYNGRGYFQPDTHSCAREGK
jgi:hypothetical protein